MHRVFSLRFLRVISVVSLAGLSACQAPNEAPQGASGHAEGTAHADELPALGPHGGRLFQQGEFAVEIRIEESAGPPRWQIYAYSREQALPATDYRSVVETLRLDGSRQSFPLLAVGAAQSSEAVVEEPHSFDVTVRVDYQGHNYRWSYPSPEGRSHIAQAMAAQMNLGVEQAGPQRIAEYVDVLGRVDFAPDALATLRAQFPGRVIAVLKKEGERVQQGEVLAQIEASASLRSYAVRATLSGLVLQRGTNVGDVVDQAALFVIGDPQRLRVAFHVYPGDYSRVRPGQSVAIHSIDGAWQAHSPLVGYLPTTEAATQTLIAYAELNNDEQHWLPGMTVSGRVEVQAVEVPIAVRTAALQQFRDWRVVFAQFGEDYEVRPLQLGRQNEDWSEVIAGLAAGQAYVTENSYLIKADIEKAGAEHAH